MVDVYEIVVIGGGIVGLATALALSARWPLLRMLLVEKAEGPAAHQTGHNSGVIHSGIYYKPGSLKARLCVAGARRMVAFCQENGIPYDLCGKLIVATTPGEIERLDELYRRGDANGVPGLRRLSPSELREVEPFATGLAALHVPGTGIVDYRQVAARMVELLRSRGVEVRFGTEVTGAETDGQGYRLLTGQGPLHARRVINCAGLHSDRVARLMGVQPGLQIVPFRGEYYHLRPGAGEKVRGLIYPVPDPSLPFLGVHLTRMIGGGVEAGPNAVLALAREGYSWGRLDLADLREVIGYRGFRSLARRWWRTGLFECYRSFSKGAFVRSLQRLMPALRPGDLAPGGAGVRAQAVAPDGKLVDDFCIVAAAGALHVLNAPSPAATASLAIGDYLADLAAKAFGLA